MKCARRLDNATKSYELMENPILFPLGIFPAPVRHIVESLQKYEHYQVDFTAVSFFTAFAAAMGNRQPALQLQPLQRFGRKLFSQPVQWYSLQIHPQVEQRVYLLAQSLLFHYRNYPTRHALLAVWRETLAERLFLTFPESLSGYSCHAILERGFHAGRSPG